MKRLTAFLKRRPVFCCLLAAAVLMTAFSGVQTSRAALTMASNNYNAQLVTDTTIHAALLENGTRISDSADPAAAQPLLEGPEGYAELPLPALRPEGQAVDRGQAHALQDGLRRLRRPRSRATRSADSSCPAATRN